MATNTESLDVLGLTPNQSYVIKVFATYTDAANVTHVSDYSLPLQITTPALSASGGNFKTTNYGTDIELGGGSVFAGSFGADPGQIDVIKDSISGTGVILNQTGLVGVNNGVKSFYIDSKTGNAVFAGTVTAGQVILGSNITTDSFGTGLASNINGGYGLYLDAKNYWMVKNGITFFSVNAGDVAKILTNQTSANTVPLPNAITWPATPTAWAGSTLNISWNWNPSDTLNQYAKYFLITFTEGGVGKQISIPTTSNTYAFTLAQNQALFGIASTNISISIQVQDSFGNLSAASSTISAATYPNSQIPPVISPGPINNGYTISYAAPTDPATVIQISESTTSSTSGYSVVYSGTLNPVTILASNLNQRWVKARFVDALGNSQGDSNIVTVTPISPVSINTNAPNEVNSLTVGFTSTGTGNDIAISTVVFSKTITSASGSGGTMLYTTSAAHGLATGDQVKITGLSDSSYNITGIVTVPSGSTTTFTLSGSGTATLTSQSGTVQYAGVTYIAKLIYNSYIPISTTGTIGTVSGSGPYTATITAMSSTTGLIAGSVLQATSGTGNFGTGTVTVVSVLSSSSVSITSNSTFTAGTITSITTVGSTKNGYFYFNPDGTGSTTQNFTILASDLYGQFGAYYSSFTGLFITVNQSGIRSTGAAISSFTRTPSITGTTPAPSIIETVNGFVASFDFSATTASYAEVYAQYYPWTTAELASAFPDYMTANYSSGGASGTNTVILTNFQDDALATISPSLYLGFIITGTNVPANTFVSAVSGSGPTYTLTLSTYNTTTKTIVASNFTGQASGTYKINSLIYSGQSPANIYSSFYAPTYLVVRYYDPFGNYSAPSTTGSTAHTPINPVTSYLSSAIQVGSGGSIYVGTAGSAEVLIGANGATSGIFAFSATDALTTTPSTSIIADPASSYTFITNNAHIGDWVIKSGYIQNDLSAGAGTYTGLSGSAPNGYSIWAGSGTSGNTDGTAKFTVTPAGAVTAKNIVISGDGTTSTSFYVGGSSSTAPFRVTNTGALTATSATIIGNITAQTGNFTGNVGITNPGSLYSGTALALTITAVTPSTPAAGSVRYTLSGGHGLTTNSTVYITGISPSGYNGVFKVQGVGTNTFDVTNATTGAATISTTAPIAQVIDITTGYILNSNGIVFNTSGTKGITTIDSSTGLLTTTSANIGGWLISPSTNPGTLYKTSSAGTIALDSSNARISVTSTANPTYSAGINTPGLTSDVVFWAGNGGASSTGNQFYVTAAGYLYANNANISGSIVITGGSTLTSINSALTQASAAALAAANAQTTANAALPANNLTSAAVIGLVNSTKGSSANTYIVGGAIATGTIVSTGFNGSVFDGTAFSTTGSAINLDNGSITTPSFRLTSSGVAVFKGSITSGSTITGSSFYIDGNNNWNYTPGQFLVGDGTTYISVTGGTTAGTGSISMQTTTSTGFYTGSDGLSHSQAGVQTLGVSSTGIHINGLTVYGSDLRIASLGAGSATFTRVIQYAPQAVGIANAGDAVTGFAVYYSNGGNPLGSGGATTGFVGDLWVQF